MSIRVGMPQAVDGAGNAEEREAATVIVSPLWCRFGRRAYRATFTGQAGTGGTGTGSRWISSSR